MRRTTLIGARCTPRELEDFEAACRLNHAGRSAVLRSLMREYVRATVKRAQGETEGRSRA